VWGVVCGVVCPLSFSHVVFTHILMLTVDYLVT
jgi:hypothetical protein